MKKSLKILATIVVALLLIATFSQVAFAATTPEGIVDSITPNTSSADASKLTELAGKVIGLIQIASAVAAVVLVAVFGFKFILGSANEKADYQKSFIPLIVGVIVVFSATSIAKLLFSLMG